MQIIPRYLLLYFLKTFALWFVCIIGIYVIFDLFTNFEQTFTSGDSIPQTLRLLATYYFYKSLPFYDMISGLLAMASAMITISVMMRNNEMIPLLAAGIPEARIIRPVIFGAIFMTLLATVFREALLPGCIRELDPSMTPKSLIHDEGLSVNTTVDYKAQITFKGDRAFQNEKRISSPSFSLPKELSKYGSFLQAENAYFLNGDSNHPSGYLMQNVAKPSQLSSAPSLYLGERLAIVTPKDGTGWLGANDCFVISDVPFEYLVSNESWRKYASTLSIISAIRSRSIDLGMESHTLVHGRIVKPFLDVTLLVLGISVVVTSGGRNVFRAVGIASLVIGGFFALKILSELFGTQSGMPVLGAWFPLMVFLPISVNMYAHVSK